MKKIDKDNSQQQFYFTEKTSSPYFPSHWENAASIYDLYGILLGYLIERFKNISDREALKSDWERVGQDIKDIMLRTQNELGAQLKNADNLAIEEAIVKAIDKINAEIEIDKVIGKKQNEQTEASTQ